MSGAGAGAAVHRLHEQVERPGLAEREGDLEAVGPPRGADALAVADERPQIALRRVADPDRRPRLAIHRQRQLPLIRRDVDRSGARRRERHALELSARIEPVQRRIALIERRRHVDQRAASREGEARALEHVATRHARHDRARRAGGGQRRQRKARRFETALPLEDDVTGRRVAGERRLLGEQRARAAPQIEHADVAAGERDRREQHAAIAGQHVRPSESKIARARLGRGDHDRRIVRRADRSARRPRR